LIQNSWVIVEGNLRNKVQIKAVNLDGSENGRC